MELLTRKYGPLPGWAWAAVAAAAALGFWYFRRPATSGSTGQASSSGLNPAASAIPFVPSVTVTGIPAPAPVPAVASSSTGQSTRVVAGNWNNSGGIFLYNADGSRPPGLRVPAGTVMSVNGAPTQAAGLSLLPVDYLGGGFFVAAGDVQPATGGMGGWGYAGSPSYASTIGGWTVGWQPFTGGRGDGSDAGSGGGGSNSVNRTRAPRARGPRLLGGQGGAARAGGPKPPSRNLRRRNLSGR